MRHIYDFFNSFEFDPHTTVGTSVLIISFVIYLVVKLAISDSIEVDDNDRPIK